LSWQAGTAIALMGIACAIRVLPEMGIPTELPGLHYMLAALCWSGAFAVWLMKFLPFFLAPSVRLTLSPAQVRAEVRSE
jgi:uncharacterized protein involved in response to NO